jgi:hypothetical protein
MNNRASVALLIAVLSCSAHAADSFGQHCLDLAPCAKFVGELLGQRYLFDSELHGKVQITGGLEPTPSNAEILFTALLHQNGFTRVPVGGEAGTFQILRERDARDSVLPVIAATQEQGPRLPAPWDMMTLKYKASNPDAVEEIARTVRGFMPASSRVVSAELSSTLWVTASAPDLKKIYELIRENDQKPTPEMKKRWAERAREHAAGKNIPADCFARPAE